MKFIIKKSKSEEKEVELYLEEDEDDDEINLKLRYTDEDGYEETEYLMTFRDGRFYRQTGIPEEAGIDIDSDNRIKEEKD